MSLLPQFHQRINTRDRVENFHSEFRGEEIHHKGHFEQGRDMRFHPIMSLGLATFRNLTRNTIGNNLVFCFCARARYRILALGGPGDEVVTKEDCIPRSGPVSVRAPSLICIRVDHKLRCG
jgi:hypothetical protein